MIATDELVKAATGAAIGALTKAAAEPALAAGAKIWGWIKTKLTSADPTIAAVEADPAKPSAPTKITALLQDLLHGNPAAEAELRKLLEEAGGVTATTQTANITGGNNRTAQTAGSNNTVQIS